MNYFAPVKLTAKFIAFLEKLREWPLARLRPAFSVPIGVRRPLFDRIELFSSANEVSSGLSSFKMPRKKPAFQKILDGLL